MSVRLYVGNLPKEEVDRQKLQEMFAEIGENVTTKVIKDRKSGKCRGFAFVTVPTDEMADALIEKFNGQSFMESPLKIEKALPRSKGKSGSEESQSSNTAPSQNKRNKRNNRRGGSQSNTDNSAVQPDPRWANELAQLKEMLAAQTSNS